jgi:hypothetical protein
LQDLPNATGMLKSNAASRPKKIRTGHLWGWARNVFLVAAAGLAFVSLDNNFSVWATSRETFALQLDHAIHLSTSWLAANRTERNFALLYMIDDMAEMSGEIRLRRIVDDSLKGPSNPFWSSSTIWRRMVDKTTEARPPSRSELNSLGEYQRWILYGVAPHQVLLTDAERSNMFSPNKYFWGRRTHQLFALLMYRKHGEDSEATNRLVDHLCEGIAFEADWDFRITDLYVQRIAFMLAARRPDLVKRRWVERILARQERNGGWIESWYGWGPGLFEFGFGDRQPTSHTTVQGMWALYMLKYRYRGWIEHNYS